MFRSGRTSLRRRPYSNRSHRAVLWTVLRVLFQVFGRNKTPIVAVISYGRSDQASIPNTGTCTLGQVTALGTITPLNAEEICAAPGGPIYPLNFACSSMSRDQNYMMGFGADQKLGELRLNFDYTRTYGRSALNYFYTPGGAITVANAPLAGSGMPDIETVQETLDVGLTKPIGTHAAVGLGSRFESGDIEDWHYRGLDTTHVVTATAANLPGAVMLDSGPRDYRVHIARLTLHWKF